jgi:2'-5' RNA ligase
MLHQHKQTIPTVIRDFPEWHRGRKEFTLWMIELEHDVVRQKVEAARRHLSGFLLASYQRQPHVTLFVCGFLADNRRFDDDYSTGQFDAHYRLLKDSMLRPFSIKIGVLNSFASAPFFHVYDAEGGIELIRTLLATTATEVERERFVPHVTVGLYSGAFKSGVVLDRINTFSDEPVTLSVNRITFAAYESSKIAGPLLYRQQLELAG